MADPKDTTGGRDYGRRTYISKRGYSEQKRLASDFQANKWRKHSEFKQPYAPDISYPEMEGYDFPPWNPHWPRLPDTPVTVIPVDPGGPIVPHEYNPDDPNRDFLGCFFSVPLTPKLARPGETAYARLAMRDDPVIRIEIHGPATLLSRSNALCTNRGQQAISGPKYANVPECTVIIRVNEDISGFGKNEDGLLLVVVVAHTESGSSCSTDLIVATCTDESIPPQWDYVNTPETIGTSSEVAVFLEPETGTPPFTWSISGVGASLAYSKTTARVNFVRTTGAACGWAQVTVVDDCDLSCIHGLRVLGSSGWVNKNSEFANQIPGPATSVDPYAIGICSLPAHHRIFGDKRVSHCFTLQSSGGAGCPNSASCSDCQNTCLLGNCDPVWGCTDVIDINGANWFGGEAACILSNRCIVSNFGECTVCPGGEWHTVFCECNSPVQYEEWECI